MLQLSMLLLTRLLACRVSWLNSTALSCASSGSYAQQQRWVLPALQQSSDCKSYVGDCVDVLCLAKEICAKFCGGIIAVAGVLVYRLIRSSHSVRPLLLLVSLRLWAFRALVRHAQQSMWQPRQLPPRMVMNRPLTVLLSLLLSSSAASSRTT